MLILYATLAIAVAQSQLGAVEVTERSWGTLVRLQAISVASEDVAWASGLEGTFLRTVDGGATWKSGVVEGAQELQFRDVHAVDSESAYLLSAGAGDQSRIFKTSDGGREWELLFTNEEPDGFFDCMDFWDADHGLAYGDSLRGELVVIATSDGRAWQRLAPDSLPAARPGEGGFAASGICLITRGEKSAFIATGAGAARVLRTSDRGRSWESIDTPVVSASATSGLTAIAFANDRQGIVVGGDISEPDTEQPNVATTTDGGASWKLPTSPPFAGPIYGVAHIAGSTEPGYVVVGPKGAAVTLDGAHTWQQISDESYWSVAFAPSGRGFMVGPEGRIATIELVFREQP